MEENIEDSGMAWIDAEFDAALVSTELPDLLGKESAAAGTLIIIVIAAVFTIVLLFVIAIFIDWRQHKLLQLKATNANRILKLKLPKVTRVLQDDQIHFADKLQVPEPTSSADIV